MKNNQRSSPSNVQAPRTEAFLPMLFVVICLLATLVALIIDRFIYHYGADMLSPALSQIVLLLIPACLCLMLQTPEHKASSRFREIGVRGLEARYVFLTIFTALFMICMSFVLNILFGGVQIAAKGLSLLGIFTAGINEFTISSPYLIVVYAIIPAIIEETVFRGVLFRAFKDIDASLAFVATSVIYALFSFSLAGIPTALFCGLTYCFILHTTGSLLSCMLIHFVFNFYALFFETNLSQYFLASQDNTLLIIVTVIITLICCVLFFSEAARVYKAKVDRIKAKEENSDLPAFSITNTTASIKSAFSFRPTLICTVACALLYIAAIIIIYITGK